MQIIYCDGSAWRNNCLCVIKYKNEKSKNYCKKLLKVINEDRSQIQMEYLAFIEALKMVKTHTIIYTDCMQLFQEINGFKRTDGTNFFYFTAKQMINNSKNKIEVVWTKRNRNTAGIILDRRLKRLQGYLNDTTCDFKAKRKERFRRIVR